MESLVVSERFTVGWPLVLWSSPGQLRRKNRKFQFAKRTENRKQTGDGRSLTSASAQVTSVANEAKVNERREEGRCEPGRSEK
ncbi:hypothetical protein VTH06DRAFT_4521 [Thermothelomyces fergusii]